MNDNLYVVPKNVHTKLCMFTANVMVEAVSGMSAGDSRGLPSEPESVFSQVGE